MTSGPNWWPDGRLEQVPWDWVVGTPEAKELVVVWFSGPSPLERVDVDESEEAVRIGLFERLPPARMPDGTPIGIQAVGIIRCVRVALAAPRGHRRVLDSLDGAEPAHRRGREIQIRSCGAHAARIRDEQLQCPAMPSGEPVDWRAPVVGRS